MKTLSIGIPGFIILVLYGGCLQAQLEVSGSGNTSATVTLMTKNSNPDTTFYIRDDGRVGVGTTKPLTKFDVNGLINAGSGVQFPDGSIQVTAYPGTTSYARHFVVAATGGHFATITAALNACGATGPANSYLIEVMPGTYSEDVNCKKYVHLLGAGKHSAVINGTVRGADSSIIEGFCIRKGIICNQTSPTILFNYITNTRSDTTDGIFIATPGQLWVKENEIDTCNGWGIRSSGIWANGWFIANKITRNDSGGITCINSSPRISNNFLDHNKRYGIYLAGGLGSPAEPTIDDNVIGHTDYVSGGIGIYMKSYAEPRIMSNDIYLNECGIWIDASTQPSIIGNNINYNFEAGIRCFSKGASKRVVITSNHIHSNIHSGSSNPAGIWVVNANPMITFNNITQNDTQIPPTQPDIDYSWSVFPTNNFPVISSNMYDRILTAPGSPGLGNYNTDSNGNAINP